jgi:hypothetical protein
MGKKKNQSEVWSKNKSAFTEVMGDPYAKPDPIEGQYSYLKNRSSISVASKEEAPSVSINEARPSVVDFFCDVEAAIIDGMLIFARSWREPDECLFVFHTTYITEDDNYYKFDQGERNKIEQIIGRIFRERDMSPVRKYFSAIRRKRD